MPESAEGYPAPAVIPCAKYVSSSFAQGTRIWLQDTGRSKSSNAVTITYHGKALLFLCLGVNFFLKMLLISLYPELESFGAVNFKLETPIQISQSYIHKLSTPTVYPCNFSCSFFSNSLRSKRWWRERGDEGGGGQEKDANIETLKPRSSRDPQHHSQSSSRWLAFQLCMLARIQQWGEGDLYPLSYWWVSLRALQSA